MDTSIEATAARLRRLYSGGSCRDIYGVRGLEAGQWHREQDERALAKAWLAENPEAVTVAERGAGPCSDADRTRWELLVLGLIRQLPRDNPVRKRAERFLYEHGDGPAGVLRDTEKGA